MVSRTRMGMVCLNDSSFVEPQFLRVTCKAPAMEFGATLP